MGRDPNRIYWVDYTTEQFTGNTVHTIRIVTDGKVSRAELKSRMADRDVSQTAKIVKVRSEITD